MKNSKLMSANLFKAAGFNTTLWTDDMLTVIEREVISSVPTWASFLAKRYGWRWPLWACGLKTWQRGAGNSYQSISVAGSNTELEINGHVDRVD